MVYEGRGSRGRYSSSRRSKSTRGRGKSEKKGGGFLTVCIWVLLLAVGVRAFFPETAERIKDKAMTVIGADYGKLVRVFGEELGEGTGLIEAAKEAFTQAFKADEGDEIQVLGDGEQDAPEEPVSAEGDDSLPAMGAEDKALEPDIAPADEPTDAVAAFKASLGEFEKLEVPARATYDMPELSIDLALPVSGTLTSGFGYRRAPSDGGVRFHYGVDIGAESGTDVQCAADGTVTAVGDSTTYGLYVIVKHEAGAETIYAHMSEVSVEDGQTVKAGERLGAVGETGNATGPCLHLELLIDGNYVNPEYYLTLR